jgi:hypothetical protein
MVKDHGDEEEDKLILRINLRFMQELIADLSKWNPGIFKENIPEPILKEGEL